MDENVKMKLYLDDRLVFGEASPLELLPMCLLLLRNHFCCLGRAIIIKISKCQLSPPQKDLPAELKNFTIIVNFINPKASLRYLSFLFCCYSEFF